MIGRTIGHYRILEEVGRGGMGVVYKARDTRLDRIVALKFLPPNIKGSEEEQSRFLQEAKAAAALNHPHACAIYRIDEHESQPFIEMEYVDGQTLREKISAAPIGGKEAIAYGIQIGEALQEAHSKGIVHRDVKAENIMVSSKDQVKVMDFGLAKLKGSLKLTKTSSTVGTLAYMAPEQIQGGEVDARSDIFSFGVVLYEMLSGKLPFRGEHDASMMYSILNEEPSPLASDVEGIDPELDRIIGRALEKDPDDRYQHVDDMVSELRRLRKQSSRVVRPQESGRKEKAAAPEAARQLGGKWMGIGAIVVLVAAGFWYLGGSAEDPLDSVAVLPFVNATGDPESDYLAEGITENITNRLSKLSGLRVIPRSMVSRYAGTDIDPHQAGIDLNVAAVLTGKVTQRGDELTIQTEIMDIRRIKQLWGEQFNRKLSDIVTVQQEIAQAVVENLETQLSGEEEEGLAKEYTTDPEAYKAYLKGRYFWNKRTADGYNKALPSFQKAIEIDPSFALAYVGIADCYFIAVTMDIGAEEAHTRARKALQKALELAPDLAEAYAGLGATTAYYDFDYGEGEKYYRRSIELNPNYATAHHWLAEHLVYMGRFEEGLAEYRRALELDPASLAIASDFGLAYHFAREHDKSIEELKKVIEMDPNFVRTHFYIVYPYVAKGMYDEAVEELVLWFKAEGESDEMDAVVRGVYSASGFQGVGKLLMQYFLNQSALVTAPLIRATVLAGEYEQALTYLEQAYEERHIICSTINVEPLWDPVRDHPRFQAIIEKMDFPR